MVSFIGLSVLTLLYLYILLLYENTHTSSATSPYNKAMLAYTVLDSTTYSVVTGMPFYTSILLRILVLEVTLNAYSPIDTKLFLTSTSIVTDFHTLLVPHNSCLTIIYITHNCIINIINCYSSS